MAFDDHWRNASVEQMIYHAVTNWEVMVHLINDEVYAISILMDVRPGRDAQFVGWVNPKFRKQYRKEKAALEFLQEDFFTYAWDTLKLQKLTAECAVTNRPAGRFLVNSGFREIGLSSLELLIQGQLYDTVKFEKLNPIYVDDGIEVKRHGSEGTKAEYADGHGDNVQADTDDDFASGVATAGSGRFIG